MKLNQNTKIYGEKVILVPYKKEHVAKYHSWMDSEELRQLTASEKLSLEEEYNMQQSWLIDEKKCTFIILDEEMYVHSNKDEIAAMIGDTNVFLSYRDGLICAEAEIMIAEIESQGKKRGWEAMLHMILYAIDMIGVNIFFVKIESNNYKSVNMFKKMGFIETESSEIFNELTMEIGADSKWTDWVRSKLPIHEVLDEKNIEI